MTHQRTVPLCTPLWGLLLVGGRSRRMGRDKATLNWHGSLLFQPGYVALTSVCERVFLSCNAEQASSGVLSNYELILDAAPDLGPLNALRTAQSLHPGTAFALLPCDSPGITSSVLDKLTVVRSSDWDAVVAVADGRDQPLTAVYEPGAAEAVDLAVRTGRLSFQELLPNLRVHRVPFDDPAPFRNLNTPDDFMHP